MAHQSRADLNAVGPDFQARIEASSNTVIVSGVNNTEDVEHFAGMIGTRTTEKETRQVSEGIFWDSKTGVKSVRDVEEYIVHPKKIRALKQGEVLAISRTVDPRWALVNVPAAEAFKGFKVGSATLTEHLRATRSAYLEAKTERYLDLSGISQKPSPKIDPPQSSKTQPTQNPVRPPIGQKRDPEPDAWT